MLLHLLKRDLLLHRMLLILPLLVIVPWGYLGAMHSHEQSITAFIGMLTLLVTILLPLSFHLREVSEGTMGGLATLPVTRTEIVQLRFLEALVLPVMAVALFVLEGSLCQVLLSRTPPTIPGLILRDGLSHPLVLAWTFFWCFAYPLPAVLRWRWKGLGLAIGLPILGLFCLGQLMIHARSSSRAEHLLDALGSSWQWIQSHHGMEPLLIGLLLALSFLLSGKALAAQDL